MATSLLFRNVSRVLTGNSSRFNNLPLLTSAFSTAATPNERFEEMVKKNKVVVFMKGVPEQPLCGFSNAVVQIFRMHGVQYDAHNVLSDESIRQGMTSACSSNKPSQLTTNISLVSGIKEFTSWPTIPQIFIG